ncbi:hypothetical protein BZA77DRAFT_35654 [Pyronema omphalodes]|nr:hypothetical protein BZA77DRAFT_35654 [Pyronema omphalodes]
MRLLRTPPSPRKRYSKQHRPADRQRQPGARPNPGQPVSASRMSLPKARKERKFPTREEGQRNTSHPIGKNNTRLAPVSSDASDRQTVPAPIMHHSGPPRCHPTPSGSAGEGVTWDVSWVSSKRTGACLGGKTVFLNCFFFLSFFLLFFSFFGFADEFRTEEKKHRPHTQHKPTKKKCQKKKNKSVKTAQSHLYHRQSPAVSCHNLFFKFTFLSSPNLPI